MDVKDGQCPICRNKDKLFDEGKIGLRFYWLLQQLEERLQNVSKTLGFSAQPPELILINALDAHFDNISEERDKVEKLVAGYEDLLKKVSNSHNISLYAIREINENIKALDNFISKMGKHI